MYFPMFVELKDKICLVVGGGSVALRKVRNLRDFEARVEVVSPFMIQELEEECCRSASAMKNDIDAWSASTNKSDKTFYESASTMKNELSDSLPITLTYKPYDPSDLNGKYLVVAATDDKACNRQIARDCRSMGIPVNAVDDQEYCDFIFPSYIRQGDLTAAVSSGGKSPLMTQYVRDSLKESMTPFLGEVTTLLGSVRDEVKEAVLTEKERREIYKNILMFCLENDRLPNQDEIRRLIHGTNETTQTD